MTTDLSLPTWALRARGRAMLTCAEVAQHLRVSTQFVRDEIAVGRLHAHRFGARAIRVEKADLAAYIDQCDAGQKRKQNLDSQ